MLVLSTKPSYAFDLGIPAMTLKQQVTGINEFLTDIYDKRMRLSILLHDLGFSSQQIEKVREENLEYLVSYFIGLIKNILTNYSDGERLYLIITRRYGLDGSPADTLQALGQQLSISRERVRQLERKALRRCQTRVARKIWETGIYATVSALLESQDKNNDKQEDTEIPEKPQ